MSVKFSMLWLILLGGVAYDVVFSAMHWFPNRGLAVRLSEDFDVALFIISAWLWVKIFASLSHREPVSACDDVGKPK